MEFFKFCEVSFCDEHTSIKILCGEFGAVGGRVRETHQLLFYLHWVEDVVEEEGGET